MATIRRATFHIEAAPGRRRLSTRGRQATVPSKPGGSFRGLGTGSLDRDGEAAFSYHPSLILPSSASPGGRGDDPGPGPGTASDLGDEGRRRASAGAGEER